MNLIKKIYKYRYKGLKKLKKLRIYFVGNFI